MTKLKISKNIIFVGFLFLIVLAVILVQFYWFQVRPSKIRSKCSSVATAIAEQMVKDEADRPGRQYEEEKMLATGQFYVRDYESAFEQCLDREGLKN